MPKCSRGKMGALTLRNFISFVFSSSFLIWLSLIVSPGKLYSLPKHVCLPPCQNLPLYLRFIFACLAGKVFSEAGSCRGTCRCWPLHPHFAIPQLGPPPSLTPACINDKMVKWSWVHLWRKPSPASTEGPSWSQTSHRAEQGVASWMGGFSKSPLRASSQGRPLPLKLPVQHGFLGFPSPPLHVLTPRNTPERQRAFQECKFQ